VKGAALREAGVVRSRLHAAAVVVSLFAAAGDVRAQPAAELGGQRLRVSLSSRLGLAKTPFPSYTAHEISGLLTSLLLEGEAQVTPGLAVRLRLPLVLAGVDQPAGSARAESAWGNPEAAVLWRLHDTAATRLLGRLALAVPLPGGDAALARRPFDNQALLLASAQRGHHEQELYAPGRVSVTPAARVDVTRGGVAAFGELKIPFMLAVARGDSDPQTKVRALAMSTEATAGVSVAWWRLRAGVAPWLAVNLLPAGEIRGDPATRWTLTIDPDVSIRINDDLAAALSATIPVAGALSPVPAIGLALTGQWARH
jgi:hypothetical protein